MREEYLNAFIGSGLIAGALWMLIGITGYVIIPYEISAAVRAGVIASTVCTFVTFIIWRFSNELK